MQVANAHRKPQHLHVAGDSVAAEDLKVFARAHHLLGGMGVPFLMVSLFFDHLKRPMGWLKRHGAGVTVSSLVLGTLGILLLMDRLAWLTTVAQRL